MIIKYGKKARTTEDAFHILPYESDIVNVIIGMYAIICLLTQCDLTSFAYPGYWRNSQTVGIIEEPT